MKKMKRFVSVMVLVVLAMTTITGCGSTGTNGEDTFLIGGLGPLTGDAASYGISVKQGAEIAIEEINEKGGVQVGDKKVKLELSFLDDEAKEDKAVTAYNSLMDDGMDALLGTVTSGSCLAVIEYSTQDGILQVTPSGSAAGITKYDNVFRLCFTDPFQGETMAEFTVNDLAKKKIAVIYNNSDEYSTGLKVAFEDKVKELGGEIVASEAFVKGDVDFSAQLTKIKSTDAEIIFIPTYYGDVAYITKQAVDLGVNLPFVGSDGWDGVINQVTDTSVLEGAIFVSPFSAAIQEEEVQTFVKTYQEEYDAVPDQFAADGYDTVYVIAEAMEKAGSTKSEDIIAAMTEIDVKGLTGDSITFDENGEAVKGIKFIEIKNGEYVVR